MPIPTSAMAAKFAQIIEGLRHTVPKFIAQDRQAGPLIMLIWSHLGRLGRRFAALAAQAEAGTLPAPRQRSVTTRRVGVARKPGMLPTGWGWLGQKMWEARCYGASLQILVLEDPEMAALIAACPQAARIVRSILWMTSRSPVPAILRVSRPERVRASPLPVRERPGAGLSGRDVKRSRSVDGSTPPSVLPTKGGRRRDPALPSLKEVRFWSQPRGKLRSTAGPLRKG